MTTHTIIHHLRRAVLIRDGAGLTDSQLLGLYVERQDETAFEALVRRHGRMVLGVCRRVLHDHHDSEDAYQATFLVLARKARSLVSRDLLANWLYGVAHKTALKARAAAKRLRVREQLVPELPEPGVAPEGPGWELRVILDEELSRLPEKYRAPLVLCDLEGRTQKDAAFHLGWPQGTLSVRLSQARKMLAKRLTRRGLALSAGSLAAALAPETAAASVSPSVVVSTVKAVAMLAAGQAVTTGIVSARVVASRKECSRPC